ncbi:MAG TPA: sigma factor-like helix-turn-helix DNA-binding protein, partial [Segeticoccus sp.]
MARMIELRSAGQSLDEIGREFGVTRERVRQLLKKHGGPTAEQVRRTQVAKAEKAAQMQAKDVASALRAALSESGPMNVAEVAAATGLEPGAVSQFWPEDLLHLRLWAARRSENRWSDDEILDAIREAALYEFPLTTKAYAGLLAVGQIKGPSLPRIWQRFGSWSAV